MRCGDTGTGLWASSWVYSLFRAPAAIGVVCVVDRQLRRELLPVVSVGEAKALDDRLQASGLGRQVLGIGVRPADDAGQVLEGRVAQAVPADDRVEAALLTVVPQLHARHVEGDGT